ncbi:MAG TPA: CaiB/BaiF CoA-transferase family protein [Sphingomicrobium sp.]|uniref:CaiB/BaiF CoA transferase family protein n=1 Tax=Novosphingobium sp. TaxID=1874826 RepID=UPI002CAB68E8|nr:CaiB/BaiF CoA-transferase family protein [Sphingomicrobium sp.]
MSIDQSSGYTSDSPLKGIKVVELTQYIAGPFAGQQLADYGADVIKVERIGSGDPFRSYVGGKDIQDYGVHYRSYNKNKKSVALDLQKPEARDIFRRLAASADVVLENFRPGVMDRLGIGYEALKELNPGLIYCSVAGFSADGPYRDRPAFDTVGQALSGILYTFVDPDQPKLRGPTLADQATGLQAAIAIMAALYGRKVSGKGSRVDVTMVDASVAFVPDFHSFYTDGGVAMEPDFRASMSQAFIMRCTDGMISFQLAGLAQAWDGLCRAIERPDIAEDPRFAERLTRVENWSALLDAMRPIFIRHSRSYWEERLGAEGIPYAAVLSVPEVHEDPEVKHSDIFEQVEHPQVGTVTMMRRAARIDRSRGPRQALPALLGEHTEAVLRDAGYSREEVEQLRSAGAVGSTAL